MRLNRTKNAIKNSAWGIINKLALLIFPFAVRTILIKTLGIDYLGLNSLFTSILNVLNLSELGIGTAIVFSMYKPIASNDNTVICALMSLYRKLYRIIGVLVLVVGIALMPFLPRLINGTIPDGINLYLLYLIYLSNTVVTYLMFAYRSCLLNAFQRTDVISKVSLIVNIFMYMTQILILVIFGNYYVYVIVQPICSALINLVNAYFAKKMYPQLRCAGEISIELKSDIKKRVAGLMMTKIAYASRNAFDSVIVSAMLGLTVVAMYNNYYYISSSVSGLMVVLMSSISAGIGNSIAMETKEKNEQDMNRINFIYMSFTLLCFVCFIAIYQPFMTLWVGEACVFSDNIMFAFSVYFMVEKTLNVIGQYYDAAGLWWHGKWKGFLEAIANLIFNVLLCKFFGVLGIVSATIVTILFIGMPLTSYYLYKYYYYKQAGPFIIKQYIQLFIFCSIGVVVYYLTRIIPYGVGMGNIVLFMIMRLFIAILVAGGLFLIVYSHTNVYKDSKEWLLSHLKLLKKGCN